MATPNPTRIESTAQDAGLTLTLQVTILDSGLVKLDGVPQDSMAGAYLAMAKKVYELEKQSRARAG